MKRLFISQPMNGKTNEEIEKERRFIIEYVNDMFGEVEVIDSFFKDAPHDANPLWFLGASFKLLSKADIVAFAKNWDKSRGCVFERNAVREYMPNVSVIDMNLHTW